MEAPENPNWANNEELKTINQKMDWVVHKMDRMIDHLEAIALNTQAKQDFGSSFRT